MKNTYISFVTCVFILGCFFQSLKAQKVAIYSFPVEIELTSDEGDMSSKDYLKDYGTKGKKRGVEFIYEAVSPFLVARLNKAGINLLPADTLSGIKSNEYGRPSATLAKAIASGIADQYMKVYLKDITAPFVEGLTQTDPNSQRKKSVRMRCRIQVYDSGKTLLNDVEGEFQSGEKIENAAELGVDFRKYQGSDYLQELKIYETCSKMAIIRAVGKIKKG
jgi:hypothetical protein